MRFFDKLTGGGVEWQLELESTSGAFRPGDEIAGTIRFVPKGAMQPRAIRAALIGVEEYTYEVLERRAGTKSRPGGTQWQRRRFSDELFRQEVELSGPTSLAAQPGEFPVRFSLPPDALPSFDGGVLAVRWQVRAWMDVGGKDPSTERDVIVVAGGDRLPPADPALAPSISDPQAQASIYVEPAPLVAGQPFRGYLEIAEQLDPRSVRVELKQRVETTGGTGGGATISLNTAVISTGGRRNVADERLLWSGQLAPMEGGQAGQRYQFAGQLPLAPIGSVMLPHGLSTARVDVVIGRRLMPDRHVTRPVAIVTG